MRAKVFLATPPFTQLNTPYPATAYLVGFLKEKGIPCAQADLGIDTILYIFSRNGLSKLFAAIEQGRGSLSQNATRIVSLKESYLKTIDPVIRFLQGNDPTLARLIVQRQYLPEASRFSSAQDLNWAFGSMGLHDHAKHLATLYLEDLSDLVTECADPEFGFSRYAERLGRSASSFDEIYDALQHPLSYVDKILLALLEEKIAEEEPEIVGFSVPFPGNLFSAFRCAQWLRANKPGIMVTMGGGFPNTELRSLSDARVFEFFHYITLDDGELPMERLVEMKEGRTGEESLKRTWGLKNGTVTWYNGEGSDYRFMETGIPNYEGLRLDKYISAIEVTNPMHSLWSDGRWNKLTMAHGCYWGKCTFCDTTLDYIQRYEPLTAAAICDRIEALIEQTGETGFHFVDEAAPPALMRSVALEILRRGLTISWWTNVRFEKSFTRDLCLLLRASGCIAVSGGLEVASDRLLELIKKGITLAQVTNVNKHFTEAGIMVHAYLMYGFPTQSAQETIDSLEVVRQMFAAGILKSGFWHRFAMTAHSPVGVNPKDFKVVPAGNLMGTFANNDVDYSDPTGADHDSFSEGLRVSILNYMNGAGLQMPLHKWFDFKTPKTTINTNYINDLLNNPDYSSLRPEARVVWLDNPFSVEYSTKTHKGEQWEVCQLTIQCPAMTHIVKLNKDQGDWLGNTLPTLSVQNLKLKTLKDVMDSYEAAGLDNFELFWENKPMNSMYKAGLLVI